MYELVITHGHAHIHECKQLIPLTQIRCTRFCFPSLSLSLICSAYSEWDRHFFAGVHYRFISWMLDGKLAYKTLHSFSHKWSNWSKFKSLDKPQTFTHSAGVSQSKINEVETRSYFYRRSISRDRCSFECNWQVLMKWKKSEQRYIFNWLKSGLSLMSSYMIHHSTIHLTFSNSIFALIPICFDYYYIHT